MASPGGPPPPILWNPRRTPRWFRKSLVASVGGGLGLLVAGLLVDGVAGLAWLGGAMVLAGLLVAAGGLWASYYAGPY